jgi:hypothetical protein
MLSLAVLILVLLSSFAGTLFAGGADNQKSARSTIREITVHREQPKEITVFVTGSLIPQRIRLQPVGTNTVSPVRPIDRREIDSTGRFTTVGAFVNEPSVRTIGLSH